MHSILGLSLFISLAASLSLAVCVCGCSKRSRNLSLPATPQTNDLQGSPLTQSTPKRININTASVEELETLPGIGKAFAERIIAHREKYGPFRKPEHLLIVRGISDKRYRALRGLITVEPQP